jgi:hypothetical protein
MDSAAAADFFVIDSDSSTAGDISNPNASISRRRLTRVSKDKNRLKQRKIEIAVFGYIRAVRTLGRKRTNTAEIADALSLGVREVNLAIHALKTKGVKEI